MKKFICIRHCRTARAGEWFIGEEAGEPLFRAEVSSGPQGSKITQTSRIAILFEELAPFIVELGFSISRSDLDKIEKMSQQGVVQDIIDFQISNEDLIEPELERRGREDNPTLREKAAAKKRPKPHLH